MKIVKNINWSKVAGFVFAFVLALTPLVFAEAQGLRPNINCPPGLRCEDTSINQLISTVIGWLLGIAFAVAVLFLILGGFWYITSAGNEETAEKGQKTAVNALIGIVIIGLSYVAVTVVSRLVGTGGSTTTP